MSTELLTISKIFHESLFRIPDYQRGYSWNNTQLEDFWTDLDQLPDGKDHYTGVLTLEPVSEAIWSKWTDDDWIISSRKFKPYYVVDGQQRLTTTVILLKNIINKAVQNDITLNFRNSQDIIRQYLYEEKVGTLSKSYIFGYEKDDPSYEFFKTEILEQDSDNHAPFQRSIYIKNLENANIFFEEKIKHFNSEEVSNLYTKVTQHLVFNAYEIAKDIDVYIAFETMNNRGKPLSTLELLKNRLIYLVSVAQNDESEKSKLRKYINETWKTIYYNLGRNESKPLIDDKFLATHLYYFINTELSKNNSINLEEIENDYDLITNSLFRYIYRNETSKFLLDILFVRKKRRDLSDINLPEINFEFIKTYVESIKRGVDIYYSISDPEQFKSLSENERVSLERINRLKGFHSSRLVFSVMMKEKRHTLDRENFLQTFERFLFISALSKNRFNNQLIENEKIFIEYTNETCDLKKVITFINNIINSFINDDSLSENIHNWFKTGGGYYSWKTINYFLYEYELYLKEKVKAERSKIDWEVFSKEKFTSDYNSIEHIYPQKAKDTSWKKNFEGFTVSERRLLRNSLGNL